MISHGKISHAARKWLNELVKWPLEQPIENQLLPKANARFGNPSASDRPDLVDQAAAGGSDRPGAGSEGLPPNGGAGSPIGGAFSHRSRFLPSETREVVLMRREIGGSALGCGVRP